MERVIKERMKKNDKYIEEREEIIKKMNKILEIDMENGNNKFILYDIQQNENKIEEIREMASYIKIYYKCSEWSYYKDKENKRKNKEIGLIKRLYKEMGYRVIKKPKMYTVERGLKVLTMEYEIER
jgi:hypothetical protein